MTYQESSKLNPIIEILKDKDLGTPAVAFIGSLVESSEGREPDNDTVVYLVDLDDATKRDMLAILTELGAIAYVDGTWHVTSHGTRALRASMGFGALNPIESDQR